MLSSLLPSLLPRGVCVTKNIGHPPPGQHLIQLNWPFLSFIFRLGEARWRDKRRVGEGGGRGPATMTCQWRVGGGHRFGDNDVSTSGCNTKYFAPSTAPGKIIICQYPCHTNKVGLSHHKPYLLIDPARIVLVKHVDQGRRGTSTTPRETISSQMAGEWRRVADVRGIIRCPCEQAISPLKCCRSHVQWHWTMSTVLPVE